MSDQSPERRAVDLWYTMGEYVIALERGGSERFTEHLREKAIADCGELASVLRLIRLLNETEEVQ